MPTAEEWERLINEGTESRSSPLRAETFLKKWPSASQPVWVRAGNRDVVVKGAQAGRQTVNDQVVGRLGVLLGAPVGEPCLVDVPQELIEIEPELAHVRPGIGHGSFFVPMCGERANYDHAAFPENRGRFAHLAILYGWTQANDHQYIYKNDPPHLVYSVDHGHFFPGGPDWTVQSLGQASSPQPDAAILTNCGLTSGDLDPVLVKLAKIPDTEIAAAVASPPDTWGISMAERLELAQFLSRRRDLLAAIAGN